MSWLQRVVNFGDKYIFSTFPLQNLFLFSKNTFWGRNALYFVCLIWYFKNVQELQKYLNYLIKYLVSRILARSLKKFFVWSYIVRKYVYKFVKKIIFRKITNTDATTTTTQGLWEIPGEGPCENPRSLSNPKTEKCHYCYYYSGSLGVPEGGPHKNPMSLSSPKAESPKFELLDISWFGPITDLTWSADN